MFFSLSTVMAILPVYTTSKLHAARINLKHLAQHRGYLQLRKRAGFWPEVGVVCKKFPRARKRARPYEPPFMKS